MKTLLGLADAPLPPMQQRAARVSLRFGGQGLREDRYAAYWESSTRARRVLRPHSLPFCATPALGTCRKPSPTSAHKGTRHPAGGRPWRTTPTPPTAKMSTWQPELVTSTRLRRTFLNFPLRLERCCRRKLGPMRRECSLSSQRGTSSPCPTHSFASSFSAGCAWRCRSAPAIQARFDIKASCHQSGQIMQFPNFLVSTGSVHDLSSVSSVS